MTSTLALASLFPSATESDWRSQVDRVLKGADFERKLVNRTADGISIKPLYPKADAAPLTREGQGGWGIVQTLEIPDTAIANAQALDDLEGGADGLTLVMAGARSARGAGLVVETIGDLDRILEGVRLDLIRLRLDSAPWAGRVMAAMLVALAEKRGLAPETLTVDFGLQPIDDLATTGEAPALMDTMLGRVAEVIEAVDRRAFGGRILRCDGRVPHEAGASEAQELAYVLASGVAYLRGLSSQGIALTRIRDAISFVLVADTDQFLTIAKFRALRLLWARVLDACGLDTRPALIHGETAWRSMTKRDPHTNMLRTTIGVFASGIGGADSITALPFTRAIGLPDPFARRVARNMQLVLLEESNLAKVADPSAGAGGIEALTDALCEKAWAEFQQIEREGGMIAALEKGNFQTRLAQMAVATAKAVASRKQPITGTSEFPNLTENAPSVLAFDMAPARTAERARLPGPRIDFDGMVLHFAKGGRRGQFAPSPQQGARCTPLPSHRIAEPFEALRDASDAVREKTGARPKIFLAMLGRIADFTARAMFAKNFFEAGGIEAPLHDGFAEDGGTNLIALTDAFKASGAAMACICSSDDLYAREAADAALALMQSGAKKVYLAGRPGELEAALRAAGVSEFVYAGCDVLAVLTAAKA
ncbi:MAG: methylmalonyl-CoA mutase family protein [Beijerinckiaceae bacterium]